MNFVSGVSGNILSKMFKIQNSDFNMKAKSVSGAIYFIIGIRDFGLVDQENYRCKLVY